MRPAPMRWFALGLLLCASAAALAEPVLRVDGIGGTVRADLLGTVRELKLGDVVGEREVLTLAADARLVLHFAPQGLIELGPGAVLAIEKLPPAPNAPDLRSILNLRSGYLHLLWTRPEAPWPLYVYAGGQRASVTSGEYFFERRGDSLRTCVAAGQLAATLIVGEAGATLRPSACYPALASGSLKPQNRAIEAWAAVRRDFALEPQPGLALAALSTPASVAEAAAAAQAAAAAASAVAEAAAATPAGATVIAATSTAGASAPAVPAQPASSNPLPKPVAEIAAKPVAPAPVAVPVQTAAVTQPTVAAAQPKLAPVAPPPAPDALPPPVPTSDAEPQWAVLIGSYADPQNATAVQSRLIAAGYTPFLRVKNVDGKTFNSVQIRGFATREAAQARVDEITTKLGLPNLRVVFLQ